MPPGALPFARAGWVPASGRGLLAECQKEPVAFLLGPCDPGQHLVRAYRRPASHVDPDRLQGLGDEGEGEVARRGRRKSAGNRRRPGRRVLPRGVPGRGGVIDFVLRSEVPRLREEVPGLVALALVQASPELAGA
jgi:hypothetical protein